MNISVAGAGSMPIVAEVAAVVIAHIIGAWLITYLLHSTVLILLARVVEHVRDEPALQAVAWRTAIVGPLFTASVHTAIPFGSPFRVNAEPAGTVLGPRPVLALLIAVFWCVLISIRLIGFIRAEHRARVALGPRHRSVDLHHLRMLATQANAARMRRGPILTTSRRIFSPVAILPGEICVPDGVFDQLDTAGQNALLAHELAHHARRDPLWCGAATAIAAVCVFQPLNTYAVTRLRRASEHAADARAVDATGQPLALALGLAALAPHALRCAPLRTAATGSPVVERVRRILEGRTPQRSRPGLAALHVTALLGTCLALGPGVNFTVDHAANSIPSLTPSRAEPTPQMMEIRVLERRMRDVERAVARAIRL
jgi:beta-lactamase regulating signal transducer with metallopeptidase domain